ncbi:Cell cycle control protein, putative [Trichomonas vaginalis G3]|uniref:Cell cycle control protein, putative n=1 Tax=Trichomonas vaginalis (strain ATCC PRA-98 / G3) TaxID=412133 RepID=A2ENV4_TRIV3|nr:mRNA splicing, via spliceosome [Trichomonas vaginalis G3]EAY05644.1 Cell cycle control protein, putative [Trichomonas vaginalis G3]KAI5553884.1 mRNA splicing, via spliceosome [Trichomonas vaginalis G3]|eukprot:XP_001317867.1 Cell cycle control protein [Trichomonas vaginalis G3]
MSGSGRPTYRTRKYSDDPAKAYLPTSHQMARSLPGHMKLKYRQKKLLNKEEMLSKLNEAKIESTSLKEVEDYADVDADSDSESIDSSSSSSDEDEDQAILQELARLKKERAEEEERKAQQLQAQQQEQLTQNPLLNPDYSMKLDWRDETVFRNQQMNAPQQTNDHINDPVRNEYHKRFMRRFVRS